MKYVRAAKQLRNQSTFQHLAWTNRYIRAKILTPGWSAVGNQTRSAYVDGPIRNDQGHGGPTVSEIVGPTSYNPQICSLL